MPRVSRAAVVAAVVAAGLVVAGIWMIVAGWPLQTADQATLMDLSQLPMSAAVLIAIVQMTVARRLWRRAGRRTLIAVLVSAAALIGIGLVVMAAAFVLPDRSLVGLGQTLVWAGIGIAFVYLAIDSVRRELRPATFVPVHDPDDPDLDDLDDDLSWLEHDDGAWLDEGDDADEPTDDPAVRRDRWAAFPAPRLVDPQRDPAPPVATTPRSPS